MAERKPDIVIFGAGIAGLWIFKRLKKRGYDVLLLELNEIGGGQSIASQGIIHSGLKYALAGKVSALAQSISAMPDLWRAALKGQGEVDLSNAEIAAASQNLMIPAGIMGGVIKLAAQKALPGDIREVLVDEWSSEIVKTGFKGSLIHMDEPVLNIPSVIRALAEPYKDSIRKIKTYKAREFLTTHNIQPKICIFTAAESNEMIAKQNSDNRGLEVQYRPLVMGLMKNAPFALYAHLVGASEKPVATITTHNTTEGQLVWYIGGSVAEHSKNTSASQVYKEIREAFTKYLPALSLKNMEWAVLPVDRVEGKSKTEGWMPDTPTIHEANDSLYCWPTKLTFAPLLSDMIVKHLTKRGISPSGRTTDWSFLPGVDYAAAPWDSAAWTKGN